MGFVGMPTLVTGQVLSAEALNRYRRNAEYCFALEAFGQPVFRVVPGGTTTSTSTALWSGRMRHWHSTLGYSVRVAGAPGAGPSFTIQVEIAGVWTTLVTVSGLVTNTTYEGTVDLSAVAGLVKGTVYPVRVNSTNAVVEVNRLFTYGSLPAAQLGYVWQAWGSFADGIVPTAAELNRFANNLNYLRDQLAGPWTPTHATLLISGMPSISYADFGSDGNRNTPSSGWRGWVNHRSDYLAYQVGGWIPVSGGHDQTISVVIANPNTAAPPVATIANPVGIALDANPFTPPIHYLWGTDPAGDFYASDATANPARTVRPYLTRISTSTNNNLTTPGTPLSALTRGSWYEIRYMRHALNPDYSSEAVDGAFQVVYEVGGTPDPAGWVNVAAFAHGDYLDGTSAKLADLKANIDLLKTRIDNYPSLLCPLGSALYFVRRGDVLLWGGTNVILHWNKGRWPTRGLSESTTTLGTNAGTGVFDLRALSGNVHGGMYYLTGSNVWALEVLAD